MTKLAFIDGDSTLWDNSERERIAENIATQWGLISESPGWKRAFYEAFLAPTLIPYDVPFSRTPEFLQELMTKGYLSHLLTANLESTQRMRVRWLKHHDLYDFFNGYIFKPDEERYEETVGWKVRMVREIITHHPEVTEVLVVDDDIDVYRGLESFWTLEYPTVSLAIFLSIADALTYLAED